MYYLAGSEWIWEKKQLGCDPIDPRTLELESGHQMHFSVMPRTRDVIAIIGMDGLVTRVQIPDDVICIFRLFSISYK